MAYSTDVYAAAKRVLEERRTSAERLASLKKADVYAKIPEIAKIDSALSRNMAQLSVLVLRGQKNLESVLDEMNAQNDANKRRKAELLSENGYPVDYLEPQYTCSNCCDTGRKNGILCSCYKEVCRAEAQKELAKSSGSASCSFDNFNLSYYVDNGAEDGTNPRRKMNNYYNFCVNYAKDFSLASPSIIMMGKTGLGKTHLSLSVAKTVISNEKANFGVVYAPAQKLVSNLEREHFSGSGSDALLRKYTDCDLLIIDDLGAEFPSSFTTSAIGNLINERLYENRPTIISTNLTGKELADRYTERTASRILGEYRKLYFVGEDIRFLKNR